MGGCAGKGEGRRQQTGRTRAGWCEHATSRRRGAKQQQHPERRLLRPSSPPPARPHLERADEQHAWGDGTALRPLLVGHGQVDDHPANQACRVRLGWVEGAWLGTPGESAAFRARRRPLFPGILAAAPTWVQLAKLLQIEAADARVQLPPNEEVVCTRLLAGWTGGGPSVQQTRAKTHQPAQPPCSSQVQHAAWPGTACVPAAALTQAVARVAARRQQPALGKAAVGRLGNWLT